VPTHDPPLATTERPATTGTYCYGVVRAEDALDQPEGVAGAPVTVVQAGDLAALTSRVNAGRMRARRRDLLKHLDVLTAALPNGPVLPFRFGTVFRDEDELVAELLEGRRDELKTLLKQFGGLVELSVKAFFREDAVLAEMVRENPRIARLREGTMQGSQAATYALRIELGELVASELDARAAKEAEQILRRLRPLAQDVQVDVEPVEHRVLRAAFLVDRKRVRKFDAEMDALAREREGRIDFKYLGPLPPHSFVALEAR
jgi:Gas vesicle synthesis protein GvpL/GvpF